MKKSDIPPQKKGHWYFITIYYCPLCGGESTYRERRHDERPDDWNARHKFIETWDYCGI